MTQYDETTRAVAHRRDSTRSHGQRNGRAIRSAPRGPKLSIVGPHLQILVVPAENREATVRPIRFVVRVLDEPVDHLEPQVALARDRKGLHIQIVQEDAQSLPLMPMRQVKARLGQHGFADQEAVGRQ